MKRIFNFILLSVGMAACPGLLLAEGYPVHEGQWEITTVNEVQGLPPDVEAVMNQMGGRGETADGRQTAHVERVSPEALAAMQQMQANSGAVQESQDSSISPAGTGGAVDPMAAMQQAGFTPEMISAMQQGRPQDMMSPEDRAAMDQMQRNGGPEQEALAAMKDAGMTPEMQQALLEATRRNEAPDAAMQKKIQDRMQEQAYGRSGVDLTPKVTRTASGDTALSYEVPDNVAGGQQGGKAQVKAGGKGFQSVTTQCLTAGEQVNMVPKNKQCDLTQGWAGDTYTSAGTCSDGTSIDARLTYAGDMMQGTVVLKGPDMTIRTKLEGRYIGPCASKI